MIVKIRMALKGEIEWINKKYDEIQFQHADFDKEIIAIAEICTEKVGVGRLVTIDKRNLELAGIYVFNPYRNQGIAGKIIEFLLSYCLPSQNVYCIPFSQLNAFYQRYGFTLCTELQHVPKVILNKCNWCEKSHNVLVELLILKDIV